MNEDGEADEVRRQLRVAIESAMRQAVEKAPGSRVAALRRTRDQLIKVLRPNKELAGTGDNEVWRAIVAAEIEAFFQSYLQQLAGRR